MADLKKETRRDRLIKPVNPKPWKVRYFSLRRVTNDPTRCYSDRMFHGVEGGCFAGRASDPAGTIFTEAMVYVDDDGSYWLPDPYATEARLDGWRVIEPCSICGMVELDRIISERLAWQHEGKCYRTYHPGFFVTKDGDGVRAHNKGLRAEALKMCEGDKTKGESKCPVYGRCRDWGLRLHAVQAFIGILGGIDEVERREMLRAARRA